MPAAGPDWKLDRRDSGRLFWRRDSNSNVNHLGEDVTTTTKTTTTPSKERVKFRYDVEVLEFWEAEDHVDDLDDGGDGVPGGELRPMRAKTGEMSSPPLVVCLACLAAILASIWYQWQGTKMAT